MDKAEKVNLRVLYTVNTSPQYILAKALEKVPYIPATTLSRSESGICYGRASLKQCALAICRSSPELRPDMTKDFSVYVLDPLEDFLSKNGQSQPAGGVAVGMGPLSGVVSPLSRDEALVTGTIVDCGTGETALEVVMSLRQLAPSLTSFNSVPYNLPSGSKRSKATTDEPFFTSKPLPSLDEQILRVQERKKTEESQKYAPRPRLPRKENPSHATRAHSMPTPYIGPPRRKYAMNNTTESDNIDRSGLVASNSGHMPDSQEASISTKPSTSVIVKDESATIASSSESSLSSMSESAILLAALSCVNSKATKENTDNGDASAPPNPNLVAFLRAYLSSLEGSQTSSDTGKVRASESESHRADSVSPRRASQTHTDKENKGPSSPIGKHQHQKAQQRPDTPKKTNTSPLAPARFNAIWSSQSTNDTDVAYLPFSEPSSSGSQQRKRKLSEVASGEIRENSVENKLKSSTKRPPRIEDENGMPINTGWGGLRMRADGTFSGGHPAKTHATAVAQSQPRPLFRSTSLASAPLRKGPYVVPDWAKGVPPPAPPPKKESDQEDKDRDVKRKRKSRAKGFERPSSHGFNRSTTLPSLPNTTEQQDQDVMPTPVSHDPPTTPKKQKISPKRTTPGMPILAQSSPLARGTFGAFFRAFQTSPIRPFDDLLPTTPKNSSRNDHSDSSKEPENVISLFTPSPAPASSRSIRSRSVLTDPPASPSPSRRRARSASLLESPIRSKNIDTLPSSLPVASSDDDVFGSSTSSESTIMHTSTSLMHDWSSLDLPPSSPPPPSSPTIAPMDNSDLPCSDIPSPEFSDVTTPASSVNSVEDEPSPECRSDAPMAMPVPSEDGADMVDLNDLLTDPTLADLFQQLSEQTVFMSNPANDALQNGLGQEDLSETWNVLNDIVANAAASSSTDNQVDNWLSVVNDLEGQELGKLGDNDQFSDSNPLDSNQLALNFEDLFQGCLV